jgi:hypothetical protein
VVGHDHERRCEPRAALVLVVVQPGRRHWPHLQTGLDVEASRSLRSELLVHRCPVPHIRGDLDVLPHDWHIPALDESLL